MKPFAQTLREDRRLVMLRLLAEQNGYRANSSVLHTGLYALAVAGSQDDVQTDLAWLAEQGLIETHQPLPSLTVAVLTARGHDVVLGQASVPGVSRPRPR